MPTFKLLESDWADGYSDAVLIHSMNSNLYLKKSFDDFVMNKCPLIVFWSVPTYFMLSCFKPYNEYDEKIWTKLNWI